MRCIVLADLHQSEYKWDLLVQAVHEHKPQVVAVAGDLLPRERGILDQGAHIPLIRESALAIQTAGAALVLIPGNDDNPLIIPELAWGDAEGLWHCVAGRVKEVKGYQFCGCPWIRDYPFGYKYWVAAETAEDIFIDPLQLGPPLTINRHNEIEEIPDFEGHLRGKPSLAESLEKLAGQVEDLSRSIWLIHQPPVNLGFDLCGSGAAVGSPAVYNFLQEKQPLLSVHGHIHEAPEVNGNIWAKKLGRTLCIQAGQPESDISYAVFDLEEGKIENLAHSLYGRYAPGA